VNDGRQHAESCWLKNVLSVRVPKVVREDMKEVDADRRLCENSCGICERVPIGICEDEHGIGTKREKGKG